ncbi:hypothetical protein [Candidatus Phytoplasma sp. AldY-WA1]|uniref:hypothetical protein n=1 Tax=Candidatus Phytoplasma sp. AldY-WA1 TaxID=2852100 RepID=UPI00254CAEF4|nr:hypothetical protein [Candidatus Phytoplasma sp. AldY-WA1]
MNKEDILLSKHAQKMVQLINQNESLSSFEIEKIKKEFYSNLFYFKTTNYGIGAFSNFLNLHIFQLQAAMQKNRLKTLKKRKIMFIQHELKDLDYSFSISEIKNNFEYLHEIANKLYQQKDKIEILNFIKNKIKENKDLQEFFKNEVSNSDEYFLILKNNDKVLKKVYKNICIHVKRNKEGHIYPKPFTIKSKIVDIKRNIRASKNNARF